MGKPEINTRSGGYRDGITEQQLKIGSEVPIETPTGTGLTVKGPHCIARPLHTPLRTEEAAKPRPQTPNARNYKTATHVDRENVLT